MRFQTRLDLVQYSKSYFFTSLIQRQRVAQPSLYLSYFYLNEQSSNGKALYINYPLYGSRLSN